MRLVDADELPIKKIMVPVGNYGEIYRAEVVHKTDLDNAPAIEVEPVRHGRIEPMTDEDIRRLVVDKGMPMFNGTCSECGAMCFDDDTYCAECGAKMDGGDPELLGSAGKMGDEPPEQSTPAPAT